MSNTDPTKNYSFGKLSWTRFTTFHLAMS